MKNILQQLSPLRRKEASQACVEALLPKLPARILSFSNTSTEINLHPLNQILAQEERLYLPKIVGKELWIYKVTSLSDTTLHPFGFLEPNHKCEQVSLSEIDLILVPGLGYDSNHHRIGYGKGFYDRLLQQACSPTWGVGFSEQLLPYPIDNESHDIPLSKLDLF